ncbi:MAG TPA: CopD family protein [Leucothrix mucor]|uniref:Protoporphyrinogen IX oxidase n=1 Tax=Leucothrix mucor TaxID=45248 RepID=A0A7V2T1Y8_LEUMU|nr:CopD family protein [Leucothrix mucor]
MQWLKTFHILFVMSWMAGIFYLPRIFVHYVEGKKAGQQVDRLAIMAKKLYGFMTLMMMLAVGTGLWLWLAYWPLSMGWLHVKILFVGLMILYHLWCKQRMKEMQKGMLTEYSVNYRWLNELPLILTLVILIMVVVKPF